VAFEEVTGLIDFNDDESRTQYGAWAAAYDLALALVRARQISGLSQSELAKRLGTSQAYIAKLESGEANPTVRKAGAILAAMWSRLEMRAVPLKPAEDQGSERNTATSILHRKQPAAMKGNRHPMAQSPII